MASTACFFHNRRAIRLSSRRANRPSSRSTRFVVTSSLLCIVGLLLHIPLPVVEGQPHVKRIPYVEISGFDHGVGHSLLLLYDAKAPHGQKSKEFKGLGDYLPDTALSTI